MRIEFDRDVCIGMFQCVAEWEAGFEKDTDAGKAILVDGEPRGGSEQSSGQRPRDGEEAEDDVFSREVPEDAELDAKFAARACPVDAITVYDDDGEQLVP
jgi:ferredoxin